MSRVAQFERCIREALAEVIATPEPFSLTTWRDFQREVLNLLLAANFRYLAELSVEIERDLTKAGAV